MKSGLDLSLFFSSNPYFMLDMIIYPEYPWKNLLYYFIAFMVTISLCMIFPIIKLFRLNPVEILRDEL
jgi:ABC-type antimicrobial peptide transport system permease subunit